MAIAEIRDGLLALKAQHGGFTHEYYDAALELVNQRMTQVIDRLRRTTLPDIDTELIDAKPGTFVQPDVEKFADPVYAEARTSLKSMGLDFSAGAWYLMGNLGSRFSSSIIPENEQLTLEESIEFCYRLGVKGMAFHSRGEMGPTNRVTTLVNLAVRGMDVSSVFANVVTETPFKYGGITSPHADVRELAYLRKLEGFIWCAVDNAKFQVDWLGQDGTYVYDRQGPRREHLVNYYCDMLELTGVPIAIEFKPGDPAIKMDESDYESCLRIAEEVETRLFIKISEQVAQEYWGRAGILVTAPNGNQIVQEAVARFSQYVGRIGINIEDAHVDTQTVQTGGAASEMSIAGSLPGAYRSAVALLKCQGIETPEADMVMAEYKGRLFHRHPNDAFVGNGDPDLVPGLVHENDLVVASYHERKAGLHTQMRYEPDLFSVRGCVLENFVESVNRINRAHAIAANLIKIEEELIVGGVLQRGQSILDCSQDWQSCHLREASEMPLNYHEIDLGVASTYREEIGKPILFANIPFEP